MELMVVFKEVPMATNVPLIIKDVKSYGLCRTTNNSYGTESVFFYERNNHRSFIPAQNVLYFGQPLEYFNEF